LAQFQQRIVHPCVALQRVCIENQVASIGCQIENAKRCLNDAS
jgi:hypothetical protein